MGGCRKRVLCWEENCVETVSPFVHKSRKFQKPLSSRNLEPASTFHCFYFDFYVHFEKMRPILIWFCSCLHGKTSTQCWKPVHFTRVVILGEWGVFFTMWLCQCSVIVLCCHSVVPEKCWAGRVLYPQHPGFVFQPRACCYWDKPEDLFVLIINQISA